LTMTKTEKEVVYYRSNEGVIISYAKNGGTQVTTQSRQIALLCQIRKNSSSKINLDLQNQGQIDEVSIDGRMFQSRWKIKPYSRILTLSFDSYQEITELEQVDRDRENGIA